MTVLIWGAWPNTDYVIDFKFRNGLIQCSAQINIVNIKDRVVQSYLAMLQAPASAYWTLYNRADIGISFNSIRA